MVDIMLRVPAELAKYINDNGIAEICKRNGIARFESFTKCKFLGEAKDDAGRINDLFEEIMNVKGQNKIGIDKVRKELSNVKDGLANLNVATKNMGASLQTIEAVAKASKTLSYINVGLSLANIGVSVAGFIVVSNKLNNLAVEVKHMAKQVGNISDVQKNEKITTYEQLIMKFNSMVDRLRRNKDVGLKEIEELLIEMRSYVSDLVRNLNDEALGAEILLNIINSIMPAYTLLFCEFLDRHYFEEGIIPANYDMFITLYDEFASEKFKISLEDYYFFVLKMHNLDVLDAINTQILLGINGRVQVEDQLEILKTFKTKDKYEQYEQELDSIVEKEYNEAVEALKIS